MQLKKKHKKYFLLILICMGLLIGLLITEIGLRILRLQATEYSAYDFDPHCGTRLKPNQSFLQQKEGRVFVRINSRGLRDIEHELKKKPGTFRIAILGDSYAEAVQVELKDTFWSVMQQKLGSCLPAEFNQVEVINFGVSGYGTAQELEMLRYYVWDYEPDLVVLAFLPGNDLRNNVRELEPEKRRPFYSLKDDQLILNDQFLKDPELIRFQNSSSIRVKDWFIQHFYICRLIYYARHYREKLESTQSQQTIEAGLSDQIYAPPTSPVWQQAWDVTGKLIKQIHLEVAEKNIPLVVMSVTSGIVVHPDPLPRQKLCESLAREHLFYPEAWLEQLARDDQFHIVLLSEEMQKIAESENKYFHGFPNSDLGSGHWNENGHRFAGEKLAETICTKQLLNTASLPTDLQTPSSSDPTK